MIFSHYLAVTICCQFEQFSRTLGDAAVEQQLKIRSSFQALATSLRSQAEAANQVWPKVDTINFQEIAVSAIESSGVETFVLAPYVQKEAATEYLEWAAENYIESSQRNYLQYHGTLEGLDTNQSNYLGHMWSPQGDPLENNSFVAPAWSIQPPIFTLCTFAQLLACSCDSLSLEF